MIITATELKQNLGKYLDLAEKEDVFITKNGKMLIKLTLANVDPVKAITGVLKNKLPNDFNNKDIQELRFKDYENNGR